MDDSVLGMLCAGAIFLIFVVVYILVMTVKEKLAHNNEKKG